jgi:hypothetical protein
LGTTPPKNSFSGATSPGTHGGAEFLRTILEKTPPPGTDATVADIAVEAVWYSGGFASVFRDLSKYQSLYGLVFR